jgi:hypothetical protein
MPPEISCSCLEAEPSACEIQRLLPTIRGRPLSPFLHLAAESVLVLTGGCDGSRAR